jgi:hypothetical protein
VTGKPDSLVPLDVIADELEQLGWTMNATQARLFTKGLILGLALGRDNPAVMTDEAKLRGHVRMLFERKKRRRAKPDADRAV